MTCNLAKDWIREEDVEETIPDVHNGPLFQQWSRERWAELDRARQVHLDLVKTFCPRAERADVGAAARALREVVPAKMNGHNVIARELIEWVEEHLASTGNKASRRAIIHAIQRETGGLLHHVKHGVYRRNHSRHHQPSTLNTQPS